ncbi:TetR/AcrR family transcriptional regulator [Ureibacillus thermophilus]|uniref:TetR/AcrR family transcriptional regulator n=2 Tax=Ureibacillus thermophilus TaxID=367743 RepID=A0A4P6UQE3_9BACL|nr:TetR/AcrR family transcriptional regulator [Ureibacillus thermophilus]QBK25489.1 TetR/AcrR family transcriptional regulator [Ureibacillus thermophilus]
MTKKILIMEKAIELFSKNGVESTSIQDITNACGISKGAFYLSFKSKDDLLVEITNYFIKKIIAKQNEILNDSIPKENKITLFFFHSFKLLEDHYSFISMCMRENFQPMNNEVIKKIKELNSILDQSLLTIIQQTFGEKAEHFKYDLLLVVRGLLISYTEFITTRPQKYNLEHLANSLAEKVNIIVEYSNLHFVTEQMWNLIGSSNFDELISKEHILSLLEPLDGHYKENPLIDESIQLLIDEMKKENPRLAILTGLVSNLQKYEEFSLIVFLIKQYAANIQTVSIE